MINVTKTYLPSFEEYAAFLKRAWDKSWITNHGELVQELEGKLKDYLNVKNLLFCSNGTIVLQMALKALNITKEVITTPFSYVATTNAILWEGCTPVFVDIDPKTFCIDTGKIEASITENTEAILVTHVYGFPCDVEKIKKIADQYKLKVIYDAAHAFGSGYEDKSLLSFGDISTCSFHATKIFHTVEGGCIVCNDDELFKKITLYRSFGHTDEDHYSIGINAKNSEFHAAMGLCILPKMPDIIKKRREISELYNSTLNFDQGLRRPQNASNFTYNYAYYPVVFESENKLREVIEVLNKNGINPRRYFHPSLNLLPYVQYRPCPISEDIAQKVLCLPLYNDLEKKDVLKISDLINNTLLSSKEKKQYATGS
jgi:dTDP-4-amino-4,6-dideoxygalactose transaminase